MIGGLGCGWKPEDEQAQLNEVGQRGWELVAGIVRVGNGVPCTLHYFRKEIQDHDGADIENALSPSENKAK
jgi:hypothetical protein